MCPSHTNEEGELRTRAVLLASAAVVAFALSTSACAVSRNAGYRTLVTEFQKATQVERPQAGDDSGIRVQVGATDVIVTINAPTYPGVVSLKYSDEPKPRTLYKYVDYSLPVAIRRSGDILYVHWAETLTHTVDWLLTYDLSGRRELSRRRVDGNDLRRDPRLVPG